MASFTAGTTFTDGVANDVTAAKLGALVTNATPTSGFIQDRTSETVIASNDTVLIGDASDSNNLKRMTVENLLKAPLTGTINSTAGTITAATIPTLTAGTTTSTAATITTGTITTGVIPTLTSTTLITSGAGTAAAPAIVPTGDTNTGIFFPAADTIAFSEGGTESMRIDSSGNLGIGTTSPARRLSVVSSTADTQLTVGDTAPSITLTNNPSSPNTGTKTFVLGLATSLGNYNLQDGEFLIGGLGSSRGNIILNANYSGAGTKDIILQPSSGNVGIGTTSPTDAKLSVYANNLTIPAISARYSSAGYKMGFGVYNVLGYPYLGFNCNQVTSSNNQTYDLSAHATKLDMSIDGSTPGFVFSTAASGTAGSAITWSERLRIDSNGNVGIGNTSPTSYNASGDNLVIGNTGDNGITIVSGTDGKGYLFFADGVTGTNAYAGQVDFDHSVNALKFGVLGTERLRIDSSGNVGIGTTGAVNKLEIVGSFGRGAPVTKTGDFTLADTENWLIVNKGSSCTVTLPAASSWTGREFTIKVITAHTVVSASSNVVPRNSATAGTAILAATAGSWATLVSNGTNWVIMCGS